jgi:acyl carrier protein
MSHSAIGSPVDVAAIKEMISEHIGVTCDVQNFELDRDLYAAGLTSLATVGLMLAIEERFDVEFPESMLGRSTFRSVATIAEAIAKLTR